MKNKRVIITSIFLVAFITFVGYYKIDKTSEATDNDFIIDKLTAFSEEQTHEEFEIKPNIIF